MQKIGKLLSRATLIIVYLSFFSVQSFFTFTLSANESDYNATLSFKNLAHASVQSAAVKKDINSNQKKTGVRLNKRFKSSSPIILPTYGRQLPLFDIANEFSAKSTDDFYTSSIFSTNTLRGPPVVG